MEPQVDVLLELIQKKYSHYLNCCLGIIIYLTYETFIASHDIARKTLIAHLVISLLIVFVTKDIIMKHTILSNYASIVFLLIGFLGHNIPHYIKISIDSIVKNKFKG